MRKRIDYKKVNILNGESFKKEYKQQRFDNKILKLVFTKQNNRYLTVSTKLVRV